MPLHRIRQRIDHFFSSLAKRGRLGLRAPRGSSSSGDLRQPAPPEIVVLPCSVPHRPPHLTSAPAIEERLSFTLDLCCSMVDLVRLNLVPSPRAGGAPQHLVCAEADLHRHQAKPIDGPAT